MNNSLDELAHSTNAEVADLTPEEIAHLLKDDEEDEEPSDNKNSEEDYETKSNALLAHIQSDNNPWGLSRKGRAAVTTANKLIRYRNGLKARIPIICTGDKCPYKGTCQLLIYDMAPVGEPCPTEIAQIELRSMGYSQDIDVENASFTDKNLLNELIMLDVMLERAKGLLAAEGTPVMEYTIGLSQKGDEIRQPQVSKSWEAYERISKKRDATYDLLMMTRKNKSAEKKNEEGRENVADLIQQALNTITIEDKDGA